MIDQTDWMHTYLIRELFGNGSTSCQGLTYYSSDTFLLKSLESKAFCSLCNVEMGQKWGVSKVDIHSREPVICRVDLS